ncbi:MAG: flagellar biosynthetic protein FliO [Rhodopirellula sp.]|nr:flagellar biosynthetic protein FliO [Rhodopirellula sp.]
MDCNQRIASLLIGTLILCASDVDRIQAQDSGFSGTPGVNAPRKLPNGVLRQPSNPIARDKPAVPENGVHSDLSSFAAFESLPTAVNPEGVKTPLRRNSSSSSRDDAAPDDKPTGSSSAGSVLAVLVVVLLFVLGLAKVFLKRSPYSISGLPIDAVDVLGRRAVDPRNSVYMVKVGSRLILLGSSPNGLSSLAEITDPIEVASLANICAAAKQSGPDAVKWLSKLWPGTTTVVESRPFEDQLGEKLFEDAERNESGRIDSLSIATSRERHRAG